MVYTVNVITTDRLKGVNFFVTLFGGVKAEIKPSKVEIYMPTRLALGCVKAEHPMEGKDWLQTDLLTSAPHSQMATFYQMENKPIIAENSNTVDFHRFMLEDTNQIFIPN